MIPAFLSVIGGLTIPLINLELPAFTGALALAAPVVGGMNGDRDRALLPASRQEPRGIAGVGEMYGETADEG